MDVCERVNSSERNLFVEQIATVVALGCSRKVDAMWHVPQRHCQSDIGSSSVLCRLLVEMPSSCAVFGLTKRKSGVNRHLRFYPIPKNSEMYSVSVNLIKYNNNKH